VVTLFVAVDVDDVDELVPADGAPPSSSTAAAGFTAAK
jgi:hypothetical protein